MIKINKLAVIALCSLFSISLHAQEDSLNIESQEQETPAIYLMKEKDGSTFFTDKPSRYSHLSIDNKTYYPTSDIHGHNSWRINCSKKKFDNMKICYMKQGDLWVFLINGSYSVSVGTDHYPRTTAGLRIDSNPAIYGYEGDLPKPLSIIERLKKGKVAYTRYQEWPYQYNKDGEVSLLEFTEQFNEMLKQYKNL